MRALIIFAIVLGTIGVAQADEPTRELTVVMRTGGEPPFTIHGPDGKLTGMAIELLNKIATELNAKIVVREVSAEQLTSGTLPDDVTVMLNVTEKMNSRFDLSHAFYSTGLAIAVPETTKESILATLSRVFSGTFLLVLIGTVALLAAVGTLMWWIEKRPIKQVAPEKAALSKSLFWAFEPVIGYKASQHQTRAGRVLGTIWGVCGVVLVSGLTAMLASQLTAQKLAPRVQGPDDLPRVRVGVVEHTAGVRYADRRGLRHRLFPDLDQALAALDRRELDAVIEDQPDLQYFASTTHPHIRVLPGTFLNHGIAFGLHAKSPLREDFNRAMMKVVNSDDWRAVLASYLGSAE